MADNAENTRQAMEDQIAELREQISSMTKSLKDQGEDMADEAKNRLSRAASAVREQGQATVSAIKENPGTATTILSTAGIVGFALGFLVASCRKDSNW